MDTVFSKKECLNDGVFVIEISRHNPKDTILEFAISYIMTENELENFLGNNYIKVKDRKVIIHFQHDFKNDELRTLLPVFNWREENLSNFLTSPRKMYTYYGEYLLQGSKIEATIHPPYYIYYARF